MPHCLHSNKPNDAGALELRGRLLVVNCTLENVYIYLKIKLD